MEFCDFTVDPGAYKTLTKMGQRMQKHPTTFGVSAYKVETEAGEFKKMKYTAKVIKTFFL